VSPSRRSRTRIDASELARRQAAALAAVGDEGDLGGSEAFPMTDHTEGPGEPGDASTAVEPKGLTAIDGQLDAGDQGEVVQHAGSPATSDPSTEPAEEPARRGTKRSPRRPSPSPRRAASVASDRKEETKVSLPEWLDDQVRTLWHTQGASFAEIIQEALGDNARPLTEDEVVAWRRRQRLHPGVRQRTLRLPPNLVDQLHQLVERSGGEPGISTLLAMLLTSHPSIVAPEDAQASAGSSSPKGSSRTS
jgi:hypothetical protein